MTKVTANVSIKVASQYLPDQRDEGAEKYAFAYKIAIYNGGKDTVQLLNRYWLITDGNGKKTEVTGVGVVGEQPLIKAGHSFVYTSGAVLDTPVGSMQGYYQMQTEQGELFEAPITAFRLAVPNIIN